MNANGFYIIVATLLLGVSSCSQKGADTTVQQQQPQGKDKIYAGHLNITADPGLEPVLRQQIEIFHFAYDSVTTDVFYNTDSAMLASFRKNKAGVIVATRMLTEGEKEALKKQDTIYVRETKLAYDAVAIIGKAGFNDDNLDIKQLSNYFSPTNKSANSPKMVFEGQNSSTVKYVVDKLGFKDKVSPNVYAMRSVDEVIEYISNNDGAIGFIPFSFVSDTDDDRVKNILKRIKILSLRSESAEGETIRVSANQSDIADGEYPLTRTLYAITRYGYNDNLEWLFVNFLQKERGARIFLKAGLIPAKMPERAINVNMESVKGGD